MNTPTPLRATALLASMLITFATVHLIAGYALPEAPAPTLAQAPSHG